MCVFLFFSFSVCLFAFCVLFLLSILAIRSVLKGWFVLPGLGFEVSGLRRMGVLGGMGL